MRYLVSQNIQKERKSTCINKYITIIWQKLRGQILEGSAHVIFYFE